MAESIQLNAQTRSVTGKKVKHLRKQGLIPATVYGKGFEPVSVQVEERAFNLIYRKVGKTALITMFLDGALRSVFVQAVQRHPLKRDIIHIDFKVVDLLVSVHVEVPVITVGESPLVARGDALINHALHTVMVEALPAELPQHLEVDISVLDRIEKSIHASDVQLSSKYKLLTPPDTVLISLTQVRALTEEPVSDGPAPEPELIRRPREGDE
ncbi:MAG: 50S ribosomal protein L25 [Oscillochloridaceae bacterium umkhey_bin13]